MALAIILADLLLIEDLPDYPTSHLVNAFSEYLIDIYDIEWKGWLLFLEFKK